MQRPNINNLSHDAQKGSVLIWLLVWLVGMAAIIYYCTRTHLPAVEAKILSNAQAAVSGISAPNVSVSIDGRIAALSGTVDSEAQRTSVVQATSQAPGVARVVDKLQLNASVAGDTKDAAANVAAETAKNEQELAEKQAQEDANKLEQERLAKIAAAEAEQQEQAELAQIAAEAEQLKQQQLTEVAAAEAEQLEQQRLVDVAAEQAETARLEAIEAAEAAEAQRLADEAEAEAARLAELKAAEEKAAEEQAILEAKTQAAAKRLLEEAIAETRLQNSLDSDAEVPVQDPDNEQSTSESQERDSTVSESLSAESPQLSMALDEATLTLNGNVARDESLLELIQTSMNAFNASYVINSVQVDDATQTASWLPQLVKFIPKLSTLSNTSVEIIDRQITIKGEAPSSAEHDNIVDSALESFSDLSLVERISISAASTAEPTTQLADDSEPQTNPEPENNSRSNNAEQGGTAAELASAFAEIDNTEILFESGSDVLTIDSQLVVESIADVLSQYPNVPIGIEGHTDSSGNAITNLNLSQLRANAVRDYLTGLGINAERLNAYGFGDGVPIADNETVDGRRLNRRIEFTF